jgi:hypothetical protein
MPVLDALSDRCHQTSSNVEVEETPFLGET